VAGQGAILTDARGRALYLLEGDGAATNGCTATCTVIWPPYLAGAGAVAPAAGDTLVRASLIGTRARENGGVQITYGGHPLYYYLGDRDSTDVLGHHVEDSWGEWALVSPGGRPLPGGRRGGRDGDSDGRGRAGRRGG
jgi:predicted lipoprotein with Yx(FWY)xxD motif